MDIPLKHTQEMLRQELAAMLAPPGRCLTPGGLAAIQLAGSPPVAAARALARLDRELTDSECAAIIVRDCEAAARVRETMGSAPGEQTARPGNEGTAQEPPPPEWLADMMAMAARACPALTWKSFLWETPLPAALHLAAAAMRMAGRPTPRPLDEDAVLAAAAPGPHPFDWDSVK